MARLPGDATRAAFDARLERARFEARVAAHTADLQAPRPPDPLTEFMRKPPWTGPRPAYDNGIPPPLPEPHAGWPSLRQSRRVLSERELFGLPAKPYYVERDNHPDWADWIGGRGKFGPSPEQAAQDAADHAAAMEVLSRPIGSYAAPDEGATGAPSSATSVPRVPTAPAPLSSAASPLTAPASFP